VKLLLVVVESLLVFITGRVVLTCRNGRLEDGELETSHTKIYSIESTAGFEPFYSF
jgi:hypothetical protein